MEVSVVAGDVGDILCRVLVRVNVHACCHMMLSRTHLFVKSSPSCSHVSVQFFSSSHACCPSPITLRARFSPIFVPLLRKTSRPSATWLRSRSRVNIRSFKRRLCSRADVCRLLIVVHGLGRRCGRAVLLCTGHLSHRAFYRMKDPELISLSELETITRTAALSGFIDGVDHMKTSRVLFSSRFSRHSRETRF